MTITLPHWQHYPLNDPEESVHKLDRAVNKLEFKGIMLFSNVNGTALSDQCYLPLYEKAHELDVVFYIPQSTLSAEKR